MRTSLHIVRGESLDTSTVGPPSPLTGISDEAWAKFLTAMCVQPQHTVSDSREYGCFALSARRLGEMCLMKNLRRVKNARGGLVSDGDFVLPMTKDKFLSDYQVQYQYFVKSMLDYTTSLEADNLPEGASKSGTLALLHRVGSGGLASWSKGKRFPRTVDLFQRANQIF